MKNLLSLAPALVLFASLIGCKSSDPSESSARSVASAGATMTADAKMIGVGATAPADADVLFDGTSATLERNWRYWEEGPRFAAEMPIKWQVHDDEKYGGASLSTKDPAAAGGLYGAADIVTKKEYRDFRLHVEFLITEPKGNSGVYLQNRYEIQIVDGEKDEHGMGAIINESPSPYHLYRGVGEWNSYDMVFRAARFDGDKRTEKALVTIYFNGELAHDNFPITRVWGGPNSGINGDNDDEGVGITDTPAGLKLQAEGHDVRYRNIWIKELDLKDPDTSF